MHLDSNRGSSAEIFGSPGQCARVSGLFRVLWPFLVVLLAAGYLLGLAVPVPGLSKPVVGLSLLLAAGILGWTVPWSEKRFKQYAKGAQGEETAARILAFLPAGFFIFHSMPMKGRSEWSGKNFDHVVAGPTGLFVVETKNWSGHITVEQGEILYDGIEPDRPPLPQVTEAAAALQEALQRDRSIEVPVQPVLCFVGEPLVNAPLKVGPVQVCDARTLRAILLEAGNHSLGEYACHNIVNHLKSQYD